MNKFFAVFGILLAVVINAGCNANGNSDLVGRWVENTEGIEVKHPRILVIDKDEDSFRVDEQIYLNGEYKTQREIGLPVSKTVISVKNGFRNIRLEKGVIFYRNKVFVKAV